MYIWCTVVGDGVPPTPAMLLRLFQVHLPGGGSSPRTRPRAVVQLR